MFTFADAKAFRLKVLLPNGFVQTGGDYSDYAGTTLSPEKPTQSYIIKGHFTDFTGESQFRLLRGPQNADATSLFVEKARLPITVTTPVAYAKAGRSGALSFQIVSYNCSSGVLQYQITGGDGSPVSLNLPGIIGGNVTAGNVLTHTFPGDGRSGRTVTGTASQSGQQIAINFTNGCTLSSSNSNPAPQPTNPNPPTNPTPSTGGSISFQIVSYDCSSGVLRYQLTGGNGSPVNLNLPGIIGGDVSAGNVLTHTFPGDARNGRTVTGTASQSGQQISINFTNGCTLSSSNSNPSTNPNPSSNPAPSTNGCGTGSGLAGLYINSTDPSQQPTVARIDGRIDFPWGNNSPAPGLINADGFSVRWSGQIEAPTTGTFTFKTNNDDGTRLWVNGQLIIDDWTGHPPTWKQGSINLSAGQKYSIKIEFGDFGGGAQAQLYWEYPGQGMEIVPSCRLYAEGSNMNSQREGGCTVRVREPCYDYYVDCSTHQVVNVVYFSCNSDGSGSGGIAGAPTTPHGPGTSPGTDPVPGTVPGGSGSGTSGGNNQPSTGGTRVATTANIEEVDCDKVKGWAFANGGGHAFIDIYVTNSNNQVFKNTIKADGANRPDVRMAYGNNPNIPLNCGFVWAIPNEYKTNARSLTIRVVPVNDVVPVMNGNKTTPGDCKREGINPPGNTNPPNPQLPNEVLTVARFYLNMSQRGIYFSEEERAVIAEYNLYERIKTFVDQYGRKPDGSNAFKLSLADQQRYPKFANFLRNNIRDYVMSRPKILNALKTFSGFSEQKIQALLPLGSGPIIVVEQLAHPDVWGEDGYVYGQFDADFDPNIIKIDQLTLIRYEQAGLLWPELESALFTLLAQTLIHEMSHYGANLTKTIDYTDGEHSTPNGGPYTHRFDLAAFGYPNTGGEVMRRKYILKRAP